MCLQIIGHPRCTQCLALRTRIDIGDDWRNCSYQEWGFNARRPSQGRNTQSKQVVVSWCLADLARSTHSNLLLQCSSRLEGLNQDSGHTLPWSSLNQSSELLSLICPISPAPQTIASEKTYAGAFRNRWQGIIALILRTIGLLFVCEAKSQQ